MTEDPATKGSALEAFMQSAQARAEDPVHKRLLEAAKGPEPLAAVQKELTAVINEILHAT